jgi:hypothetical protein
MAPCCILLCHNKVLRCLHEQSERQVSLWKIYIFKSINVFLFVGFCRNKSCFWVKTAISLERQEKSLRTSSTAKFRNRRECAFKWQVSDMNCRLFYTVVLYQVGVSYLSSDSVLSSFISVRTFGSTAILFSQRSVMYKLLCSVQHSVYIYVWKVWKHGLTNVNKTTYVEKLIN